MSNEQNDKSGRVDGQAENQQAANQQAANQQAANQQAAASTNGPTISSSVGPEDNKVDDAAIADAIKACEDKIQALNKKIQENEKERANKPPGETPRDLASMWQIVNNGPTFEFCQDPFMKLKRMYYENKLKTLNDPKATIAEKNDAIESMNRWNTGSKKLGAYGDAAKSKLNESGIIGKGVATIGTGVGMISDFLGVTGAVNQSADFIIGGIDWIRSFKRSAKAPEPMAEKPANPQAVNNSSQQQAEEHEKEGISFRGGRR